MPEEITFEPATYYDITVRCNTASYVPPETPDAESRPCENYQREWEVHQAYSNAGQPGIQCGPCARPVEILSATKMDPQPEVS